MGADRSAAAAMPIVSPRRRSNGLKRALRSRLFIVGAVLFMLMLASALLAHILSPYDPSANNFRNRLGPPSLSHLAGTDSFGRDILSRILYGGQVSLGVGASVAAATAFFGILIGAAAGYFHRLDNLLMRLMDGLMAFPGLLLAIALAAVLGSSTFNTVLALTVAYSPRAARIVRAAVLVVKETEYVEAARAIGASNLRILLTHILPNSIAPVIVQTTYFFALAVLAEAVLSFIGVGPPPPTPSWGNIIADGRNYIVEAPWVSLFPGIAIAISVLGLNLLGDGLRDMLDPRLAERRP
jgi:peptide/nickel transport system permease protein